ncbi:MAG: hypothetical protein J7500_15560 [Sphingomonas sp.]|uniref:hypothetical protein n=1 Tax=Sphingomonas sp. TaxID=28214 RepID=UPI001B2DF77D|nr:hypothetical protein [Sphingomonas sp.]MBO9624124.1 hypothetical protein [Sphingomonas sp.]
MSDAIDRAVAEAEALLEQAAIARAEAENADEKRKQVKALMFIKFRDAGSSAADAAERAMTTPEYLAAADEWMSANITWRRFDGKARGKELKFEAWRTKAATERAAMNLR